MVGHNLREGGAGGTRKPIRGHQEGGREKMKYVQANQKKKEGGKR